MNENKYTSYTKEQLEEENKKTIAEKESLLATLKQLKAMQIAERNQANNQGSAKGQALTKSTTNNIFGNTDVMHPTGFNGTTSNKGFITKIIIALLASFALGVISTGIYIFINLSKFSVTL